MKPSLFQAKKIDRHLLHILSLLCQGVFNKDTGTSKAREHALLISSRPAYVTILSLVRDAVARLPNGEGTRAEVRLSHLFNQHLFCF